MNPDQLIAFLESGATIFVGTRDAALVPDCARGFGLRVAPDASVLTLYLPIESAGRAAANLRANGEIAICLAQMDNRSMQLKGMCVGLRVADESDRPFVERYGAEHHGQLGLVGVPLEVCKAFKYWPCYAVDVRVRELFDQTPGPAAGNRM